MISKEQEELKNSSIVSINKMIKISKNKEQKNWFKLYIENSLIWSIKCMNLIDISSLEEIENFKVELGEEIINLSIEELKEFKFSPHYKLIIEKSKGNKIW